MSDEVTVSCQIPQEWQAKIERLAAERKQEPKQMIYEALAQYLGEGASSSNSRLNALEAEVSLLQKQWSNLDLAVKRLQQRLQGEVAPPPPSNPPQEPSQEDREMWEDEPDEILYDFLPPEER